MTASFEELVAEASGAPVGWDFTWLEGRAVEQRPSWGYSGLLGERMRSATATLDLETGDGGLLGAVPAVPRLAVATETWPPNVEKASRRLAPRGTAVIRTDDDRPLPFADGVFDLVSSRHPVTVHWAEIARVLRPGGTYFAQHVGPHSVFELVEFFLGRQPERVRQSRHPDSDVAAARDVGLDVVDLRYEETRIEFFDVGAVAYFLRTVIWLVPGFTVDAYREQLRDLDDYIRRSGRFVAYSTRFLIEARKP